MLFSELAQYFKRIEATASRNAITEILADLFSAAHREEIAKICYLLQGRVVPLYVALEFGVADKFVIRAVALAYGCQKEKVLGEFKRTGDLGLAAERCYHVLEHDNKQRTSVSEVYDKLRLLAESSGIGSQEKKITILANLLESVDALSARFLVRMVLDKLRLGFSDMTILDGLSWMIVKDKSLRPKLEDAYNVRPDIGLLAQVAKEKGIAGLSRVKAAPGAPILAALCQRLPNADEMVKKMGTVSVEPKYDGARCIGGGTGILTKERGYISAKYIRVDDMVLTHTGVFRKILAVKKRLPRPKEQFYRLQSHLGDECIISADHPVLVSSGNSQRWVPVSDLQEHDCLIFPKYKIVSQEKLPKELILKDRANYAKTIVLSPDLFRLLGFWVGDGYSNSSHQSERIGLTINEKTGKEHLEIYERIIRKALQIQNISKNIRRGAVNLYWWDPPFKKWLVEEFRYDRGREGHGKRIPEWFCRITKEQFGAFLQGWMDADGTRTHGGGNKIVTKERQLAGMAQIMGSSFGLAIGIRKVRRHAKKDSLDRTYYEIIIPGTERYVRNEKENFLIKIHTVQKFRLDTRVHVYDFQVEGDESYCTSMIALHNCQIHWSKRGVATFSRNLENTTAMFPELSEIGKEIHGSEVILDGEAVGINPKTGNFIPFQKTMTRKRKHNIETASQSVPLKFVIFDILYKDGKDLLSTPLSWRRKLLEATVKPGRLLLVSPHVVTNEAAELRAYHDEQIKKGLEGVVIKKWESPYEPGRRGYSWVKFKEEGRIGKLTDTIDAVIMGYTKGQGKRSGFGIGMFLVGVRKGDSFVTVTKIGTGVSDELWKELRHKLDAIKIREKPKEYGEVNKLFIPDVWVEPKVVVEIAGDDLTKSPAHGAGIAVRFPRLVRIRTDKSSANVTTVTEVEHMYAGQFGTAQRGKRSR